MLLSISIVKIIIAVVVPLTTKGGLSSPVANNSPRMSPFPSAVPSTSPSFAPTVTTMIIAALKLANPSDTSLRMDCENGQQNLMNIPAGFHDASWINRNITCEFTVGDW